jgi:glutamate/tyrosine decarboxylase-like PLP-dependent enzyme
MAPPVELAHETLEDFRIAFEKLKDLAIERQSTLDSLPTIASPGPLEQSPLPDRLLLPSTVPETGWGLSRSTDFLLKEVASALNPGQNGTRYFGFVTGGVLPSAIVADWFSTLYDQNVQVHLPRETFSTVIEAYTVDMIIRLLKLDYGLFTGTLTTGATSSNLLALICARESTTKQCMANRHGLKDWSLAEHGAAGSVAVKVFVCQAHASIKKTAAIAGIGRMNVIDVGRKNKDAQDPPDNSAHARVECLEFDMERLELQLLRCYDSKEAAIVVIGMGEVVTGALSDQTLEIRKLCDKYQAWLHMDAGESVLVMYDQSCFPSHAISSPISFHCLYQSH